MSDKAAPGSQATDPRKAGVSAVVLTFNEEQHIVDCLSSLSWADERVVLDSGSSDRTPELVRAMGSRLASRPFTNYAEQRNAALALASHEWVLFVDADERVSPRLAAEVRKAIAEPNEVAGFWIPRRNYILGRRMRGGGWWPDDQLRLLRAGVARYNPEQGVHEVAGVDGTLGRLRNPLVHLNYTNIRQLFQKQDRYSRQEALDLDRKGTRARPHNFLLQPLRAFKRRFVEWKGYRDGAFGAALALLLAWYELVTYVRLARLSGTRSAQTLVPKREAIEKLTGRNDDLAIEPRTSVIIVSWNVRDLLRGCLESLAGRAEGDRLFETIVVDNGSTDGTVEMIRSQFPDVRLLEDPTNPGFAASNNRAAQVASGNCLLLLNPDTVVLPGAVKQLQSTLRANPTLAAVGPRLVEADGSTQSSRRRFPTLSTLLVESTPLQPFLGKIAKLDRYYFQDHERPSAAQPDWLVGACLLVRKSAWQDVGGLDDKFFMYFEETDWFKRAAEKGWTAAYVDEAEVVHFYGKSSEQDRASRQIRFDRSRIRYATKHYGAFRGRVVELVLRFLTAFQIAEESIKWLLGHKRALREQRVVELRKLLAADLWAGGPAK